MRVLEFSLDPHPPAFALHNRHFQALRSPQPMNPLAIDPPTLSPQQSPDPPVSVAGVLPRQHPHPVHQGAVLVRLFRLVPLARPRLSDGSARPTFRDTHNLLHVPNRRSSPRRAQYFPWATSLRTLRSIAWSATIFFSRVFSFSSTRSRLSAFGSRLPYSPRQRWYVPSLIPICLHTSGTWAPQGAAHPDRRPYHQARAWLGRR